MNLSDKSAIRRDYTDWAALIELINRAGADELRAGFQGDGVFNIADRGCERAPMGAIGRRFNHISTVRINLNFEYAGINCLRGELNGKRMVRLRARLRIVNTNRADRRRAGASEFERVRSIGEPLRDGDGAFQARIGRDRCEFVPAV